MSSTTVIVTMLRFGAMINPIAVFHKGIARIYGRRDHPDFMFNHKTLRRTRLSFFLPVHLLIFAKATLVAFSRPLCRPCVHITTQPYMLAKTMVRLHNLRGVSCFGLTLITLKGLELDCVAFFNSFCIYNVLYSKS